MSESIPKDVGSGPEPGETIDAAPLPRVAIAEALRNHWCEIWYQPKIDLKRKCLAGAEALARIRHPEFGSLQPGEFVAEVGQLSGQPAFVDVRAIDDVEALLIPPENLRALMIEEPELGERIMRALILRRIVAIETGAGGPVLIGSEFSPDVIRLRSFLARNAYPHQLLDPEKDEDARKLVEQYAPNSADLPLAVCPKGTILKNPSEAELARALGMVPIDERDQTYDVAVVGAGPAVPLHRGLCRLRRSLGHRPRRARLRRTGRGERADRKLSRLSCRHFWPGAHRPGLRPGAEIWCPDDDTQRRGAPRPRGNADCAPSR